MKILKLIQSRKFKLSEHGFFLMEAILLGAFLAAIVGGLKFCQTASSARRANEMRLAAYFLAQEQFACLEAKAWHGEPAVGTISWLGEADDLAVKGQVFTVRTLVTAGETGLYETTIEVSLPNGDSREPYEFRRLIWARESP